MLNIAISGGGPVGLTLARLLLPHTSHRTATPTMTITIFEKDASATSRTSIGGTLDLHPPTGLAAMRAMDLWEEFNKYARWEGEEMRMMDMNGFTYMHQVDSPQIEGFEARPEIDRVRLMEVLLGAVPEEMIRWGKAVSGVVEGGEGKWKLTFADGSVEGPFDLVVGADGAWSKVRKTVSDVLPGYSGISTISGTIDEKSAGERWEEISKKVGHGNLFSFSYGRCMMLQRLGDGGLKSSFTLRKESVDWIEGVKTQCGKNEAELKRVLLAEFNDWVPEMQAWISSSKQLWCAPLWELPVGQRYEHQKGLVLIGDAAHLMTPFAGEGVNAGMRDALDLAAAIEKVVKEEGSIDVAVKDFEESMFRRSTDFMAETLVNKNGMFAEDAPYGFFADMAGVVCKELGYDLKKGLMSLLPIRPLVYSIVWTMGTFGALKRRVKGIFARSK